MESERKPTRICQGKAKTDTRSAKLYEIEIENKRKKRRTKKATSFRFMYSKGTKYTLTTKTCICVYMIRKDKTLNAPLPTKKTIQYVWDEIRLKYTNSS